MPSKLRIGMLTPSLNRSLEPLSYAILREHPEITVHFSRLRVTQGGLEPAAIAQFNNDAFVQAAMLLADAKVDVIAWNGTSGSWLGLDWERRICKAIEDATAIPATGSTLAFFDAFKQYGIKRYSLAVPYERPQTEKIIEVYAGQGLECVASDYMDIADGESFPELPENRLCEQLTKVAVPRSQGIAVVCTNVAAAPYVEGLEAKLKIPILDSIIVTLWKALEMKGIEPRIPGWGMLMRGEVPAATGA